MYRTWKYFPTGLLTNSGILKKSGPRRGASRICCCTKREIYLAQFRKLLRRNARCIIGKRALGIIGWGADRQKNSGRNSDITLLLRSKQLARSLFLDRHFWFSGHLAEEGRTVLLRRRRFCVTRRQTLQQDAPLRRRLANRSDRSEVALVPLGSHSPDSFAGE